MLDYNRECQIVEMGLVWGLILGMENDQGESHVVSHPFMFDSSEDDEVPSS
jgi:hypothetical protein